MFTLNPSRRRLIAVIFTTTIVITLLVIADLATGGRPDPPELRAAATLLDGSWRFHTGDDPRWADANTDDSNWETIESDRRTGVATTAMSVCPDYVGGWMAHGHPGYAGYAWYRRAVNVPSGDAWDILGPTSSRTATSCTGTDSC